MKHIQVARFINFLGLRIRVDLLVGMFGAVFRSLAMEVESLHSLESWSGLHASSLLFKSVDFHGGIGGPETSVVSGSNGPSSLI